eukprot:TRINITY_DN1574_c0_g1_i1.p1 TRINITY_DN1574_c0_g1~~TRINITY_DN1574_c0_g1_i1.p1  ORF type:complete len:208 (-),score=21.07 TRINITY_DN1574_c0_g1_i1:237-860(-)
MIMEGFSDEGHNNNSGSWSRFSGNISRKFQHFLDITTPHRFRRWLGFLAIALAYIVRVLWIQGFYVVTYGLGIYILHLFIAFLSPQTDPEVEYGGSVLPVQDSDEFKPFVRRLPEFKLWYSLTKAFCIAFLMTFAPIFDVPVFWPILLVYWIMLFLMTVKRQILHMIKFKYVPFTVGKQRYGVRKSAVEKVQSQNLDDTKPMSNQTV